MYEDTYREYSPEEFEYSYPFYFNDNKLYLESFLPTYTWDYGDTVKIPFKIDPKYHDWLIKLIIYNFRGEELYILNTTVDNRNLIHLYIPDDESKELFIKGTYNCRILAIHIPCNNECGAIYDVTAEKCLCCSCCIKNEYIVETIMPPEACSFYVR